MLNLDIAKTPKNGVNSDFDISRSESKEWLIFCIFTVWHSGTLFRFRRWTQQANAASFNFGNVAPDLSMISVRSYSFSRKPLFDLLEKAKVVYEQTQPQMVTIRVLDQRGSWRRVAYKHRRPLKSIILDEQKRGGLLSDAKEFLVSENWYSKSRAYPEL